MNSQYKMQDEETTNEKRKTMERKRRMINQQRERTRSKTIMQEVICTKAFQTG